MLNSKSVFILGAGASYEVGFPLGADLKKIISDKLNFELDSMGRIVDSPGVDKRIIDKLSSKFKGKELELVRVCKAISDGILWSDSIDDFIDIHKDDDSIAICGKIAIAYSIVEAEKKSALYLNPDSASATFEYKVVKDTWYARFYSLVAKRVNKNNLSTMFENVMVINFNYDRSLEYFLTHVISRNYTISKAEAQKLVDSLTIYRPYGSIDKSVEFGSDRLTDCDNIVSNLKTYTEQIEAKEKLENARDAIRGADVLAYLGMAYHTNNMNLLQTNCETINKKIYCTRYSFSDSDLPIIQDRIMQSLKPDALEVMHRNLYGKVAANSIHFAAKCTDLFEEYKLSLLQH